MLFVQLDANWPDHPKIIRAGMDGAGLHALCLCLAKRLETDGWLDLMLLEHRYQASAEVIQRLLDLQLLELYGERVRPWGWLDRNPSQQAIAAKRATKSEAGRRGNHDRWKHPGPFEQCSTCQQETQVVAASHRKRSQSESPSSPDPEPEPDPSAEGETDPAAAASAAAPPDSADPDDRLAAAAAIIANRAAQRPTATNPTAVRIAIRQRIVEQRASDATAWLRAHPDATPAELADALEPADARSATADLATRTEPPNSSSMLPPIRELGLNGEPDWDAGKAGIALVRSEHPEIRLPAR